MSGADRTGKECYWCGGGVADSGSIRVQVNEGEPKRETCPDCFRDWPPENLRNTDTETQEVDRDV